MRDAQGNPIYHPSNMAEVFANYYAILYSTVHDAQEAVNP